MSERARKALSAGRRRQLLRQRRQSASVPPLPPSTRSISRKRTVVQSSRNARSELRGQSPLIMSTANPAWVSSSHQHPERRSVELRQTHRKTEPYRARGLSRQRRPSSWLGNVARLLFLGLGLSVMAGGAISLLHPQPTPGTFASSRIRAGEKAGLLGHQAIGSVLSTIGAMGTSTMPVLLPSKELKDTKSQVQALAAAQPDLSPAMFFYNPDTGVYLDWGGDKAFPAASTIKLPILIAFFQAVDAKKARLDETLTMRKDLIASESGEMQYRPPGTKFTALETADKMITISDNTATNMLIDRLGGAAALNQRFQSWGLTQTVIHNPLPDLQGTNTISPKDLSTLMLKISQGELLSAHSRDRALEILRNTVTDTLLPRGLGEGANIAHKTGDIGSVVGDAGLIDMPNGQRYVATIMVKRPYNDPRAQELIRQVSKMTYQAFSQGMPTTSSEAAPTDTPTSGEAPASSAETAIP